jgi:flagellin-specific chaperone FliS
MTDSNAPTRQMTFGEKLVGLNFNPSNDDGVSKAKKLCADLMDLVNSERGNRETTQLESYLYNHTIGEILNAQMNVVKLLTLKY